VLRERCVIFDVGTAAKLGDDRVLLTTTGSGSAASPRVGGSAIGTIAAEECGEDKRPPVTKHL
jgi:hypothetical protein